MFSVYWPAAAVGLIVGFYWARVLHLAAKAKKQAGRAANLIPPEPLGRVLRIIWFPVVGLWVLVPFLIAFGARGPGLRLIYSQGPIAPLVAWLGAVAAAA